MSQISSEFQRILVVEDDAISYELLANLLRKLGYLNVQRAEDGATAISRIAKFQPTLVITDLVMAPVDGLELLGLIRTGKFGLPADLPVIVCSGGTHNRLVTQCIALDVNGFIVKPVTVDVLRKRFAALSMTKVVARGGDYYQGVVSGMIAGAGDPASLSAMRLLAPESDTDQGESQTVGSSPSATGEKLGYLNWSEKYSVHDNAMDSDHRRIIDLLNDAFLLHSGADGQSNLSDIASKLYQYTVDHFEAEEAMLRRVAYPKLAEHLKLHRSMAQQSLGIRLRIEALESNVEDEVFQFLKEWWLTHIQTADKEYGDYLLETSSSK